MRCGDTPSEASKATLSVPCWWRRMAASAVDRVIFMTWHGMFIYKNEGRGEEVVAVVVRQKPVLR